MHQHFIQKHKIVVMKGGKLDVKNKWRKMDERRKSACIDSGFPKVQKNKWKNVLGLTKPIVM